MGFCSSKEKTNAQPVWADPWGPSSIDAHGNAVYGPSQGPAQRQQILDALRGVTPSLQAGASQLSSGVASALNAPTWKAGANLAQKNLSGAFLNGSPALDRAMAWNRAGTLASAADATARLKAQYGKAGLDWSTANQQAAQSARAAAGAEAGRTNANTFLQNYQMERANQNAAPAMYEAALSAPLNYLANATAATYAPLNAQANLVGGMYGGGQILTPRTSQTGIPSTGSDILNGISGVVGNL